MSLVGVPAADRQGALQAQLAAWQPFPDSVFLVDMVGDHAQVFALEREAIDREEPVPSDLWPETLLHQFGTEGLRLVECLVGYEGQAWRDGVLMASRWWAQIPEASDWQTFVRQSRLGAMDGSALSEFVPSLERLSWLKPSRPVRRADQWADVAQGNERLLMGAVAVVLVAITASVAHDGWDSRQSSHDARNALNAIKEEASPLLMAREKALAAADQSAALIRQMTAPLPLDVMDQLARLLPKGVTLKEFDLAQLSLRVALELPADVTRARVVNELESGGWFTQVSEVKDGGNRSWVSFEMKLSGAQAPGRSSNDAGLTRGAADGGAPPLLPERPQLIAPKPSGKS
ncbi:hypothetical protein OOZ63_25140 [Paucibacter sp. PLA-PC-4]|uniref:hypothetical protein n=1 Tax=Paucibacter sp. PLA-PC-4 TaxID=2993655 RepID=UPI00224AE978|nr:hypothetical protein [Paucibacter sp. PLA-PC-4]MCX2865118.1 hypothetical protein [Paucibacter sp. PLA-PC-4]